MLYNIKTKTSNILSRKKIITANSMQKRNTLKYLTGIDRFFSHKIIYVKNLEIIPLYVDKIYINKCFVLSMCIN